jgi:hypothetical protein
MKISTFFLLSIFLSTVYGLSLQKKTVSTIKPIIIKLEKDLDKDYNDILKMNDIKLLSQTLTGFKEQYVKSEKIYLDYKKKYDITDNDLKLHLKNYKDEKAILHSLLIFITTYEKYNNITN